MKRAERSMVFGANWRLANAKSFMVHKSNPNAACTDKIERTERKSSVQANPLRITPAKLLCEWLYLACIYICKGVFGTAPVRPVPVWMSYRTYRSVRYRYASLYRYRRYRYPYRTELTQVSGTGVDVVPNLPKCQVPALVSYRTYRSVRYRY